MAAPRQEKHLRHTIGFRVAEAQRERKGLEFVVEAVLQGLCKASLEDFLCLQDLPAQGIYDVTFCDARVCAGALGSLQAAAGEEVLQGVEFSQGPVTRQVPITVEMANFLCHYEDVVAFLHQYCEQVGEGVKLCDGFPVWNGRWRFVAALHADEAGIGGTRHPPAVFTIGVCPGFVYYPGQPKFCSTCRKFGHFRSDCTQDQGDQKEEEEDCEYSVSDSRYPTLSQMEKAWRHYAEELVHEDEVLV